MTIPNKYSDITEKINRAILIIRGKKVMIDSDLAELFGVKTFRLNEQVKRNIHRFPKDFMFQLTAEEKQEVIANCDHLEKLKFLRNPFLRIASEGRQVQAFLHYTNSTNSPSSVFSTFARLCFRSPF
jgi:predicted XRE-type DNA-binding protein